MIHITRRREMPLPQVVAVRGTAIVLAFVVCGLVTTVLTGLSPIDVYVALFRGSFGSVHKTWVLLQEMALLLGVSLALTPAFRMKFWNLGGEGQVLMGCFAAAACMVLLGGHMANGLLLLVMALSSMAAGALWGLIPAVFKAKWNTNETLFTLMMNYIATQLVAYFVILWEKPKGSGNIGIINAASRAGWIPNLGGNAYLFSIVVVGLLVILMQVYLDYSKHGYEISVVGESPSTARYAGIKVNRVIVRTMILSGAVCGLIGLLLVGSINHTLATNLAGGRGFTGVMVAWLAKFNPLAMVASSFLLEFMGCGAGEISTMYGLNHSFGDILTGIVLFFIIGSEFFIAYKVHFQKHEKEARSNA